MGGNALKNAQTRRLDRQDFERVSTAVVTGLRRAFPQARAEVIQACFTKADLGDLDVLVTAEDVDARGGSDALERLAVPRARPGREGRTRPGLGEPFRRRPPDTGGSNRSRQCDGRLSAP